MSNKFISIANNQQRREAQPTLNGAQREGIVARWPIRHAAAAHVIQAKQRLFPETIRAISQPAVQAELHTDNVSPIASALRYDGTNERENRFEADAAREAIAQAFLPQEAQQDVEEAA